MNKLDSRITATVIIVAFAVLLYVVVDVIICNHAATRAIHLRRTIVKETRLLDDELDKLQDNGYRIDTKSPVLQDIYRLQSHINQLAELEEKHPKLVAKATQEETDK